MANICLQIGVTNPAEEVITLFNNINGLSKWWTHKTSGSTKQNEIIKFHFGEAEVNMKVLENSDRKIVWQCTKAQDEWIGTTIEFKLVENDGVTMIFFQHKNWKEESNFHYFCSMKWAIFMLSIKSYLETGKGLPFPNDIHITPKD